jgi:putative transposase
MPYWQLFYHLVWSTKNRRPLLTPEVEPVIYGYLRANAIGLEATVFALNGVEDHVHMVASIPPKIAVAKFIGQIKAVASTKFNQSGTSEMTFAWQEEYGAFSFDGKRLPNYIAYVEHQKEHHTNKTAIPILERMKDGPVRLMREKSGNYQIENDDWWQEMMAYDSADVYPWD